MALMTRNEFAEHMGVNKSTVSRWISSGRVQPSPTGKIDAAAAKRSLAATESPEPHHQARIAQIALEKSQEQNALPEEGKDEINLRYKRAMTKEREAKAELAAMERDREAGLLVERGEVDHALRDIGIVLRNALESMPDRIAPVLAAHNGDVNAIHASLGDTAHTLLIEISEHMRRKAQEALK